MVHGWGGGEGWAANSYVVTLKLSAVIRVLGIPRSSRRVILWNGSTKAARERPPRATCLPLPHPFFTVSHIPAPPGLSGSAWLIHHPPKSHTTSSPSPTLGLYSHPLLFPLIRSQCQRQMVLIVPGLLVLSGGSGDGPRLACRPALGPNDAGLGSAVWQAAGWDCGSHRESGGLWVFATAFFKKKRKMLESIETVLASPKSPLPFKAYFRRAKYRLPLIPREQ